MYLDPISDFLVRIKSGYKNKKEAVEVKTSKLILKILAILETEGYIKGFKTEPKKNKDNSDSKISKTIVFLKYKNNLSSISGVRQISKPGLRIYSEADKLPKVLNGLGIAIISTNLGLMTDKNAKKNHVGGEVIAYVW